MARPFPGQAGHVAEWSSPGAMTIVGWDIGGANVKLAVIEDGVVSHVTQIPCPAIQDCAKFDRAIEIALAHPPDGARHAVTMTGELSDVFPNRAEGVAYLGRMMQTRAGDGAVALYAGAAGFVAPEDAAARWTQIASANWHASAALVGRLLPDALLVDIGTTTTDIIPVAHGACAARGFTDAMRLATGELVYTGVVRTPVMAVARRALFAGAMQGLCAERFATMADVWRLTGDLPHGADDHPTPDGAGKSPQESAARLARMTGRDLADAPMAEWTALAAWIAERQLEEIAAAAGIVLEAAPPTPTRPHKGGVSPAARVAPEGPGLEIDRAPGVPLPLAGRGQGSGMPHEAPIVGAGSGRFLAQRLAGRLGCPYTDFCDLVPVAPEARDMAAVCAPAVAVALLLEDAPLEKTKRK
jgi:probable H4MPT-linked C1 transfer pathway protein